MQRKVDRSIVACTILLVGFSASTWGQEAEVDAPSCRRIWEALEESTDSEEQAELYRQLVKAGKEEFGPTSLETVMVKAYAAVGHAKLGMYSDAWKLLEEVRENGDKALGTDSETEDLWWSAMALLAVIRFMHGDTPGGQELGEEFIENKCQDQGPKHPECPRVNELLAGFRGMQDPSSIKELARIVESRRRSLGPEHPLTLEAMVILGAAYDTQLNLDEACDQYEMVLEIRRRVLGPENPDTIMVLKYLAQARHEQGKLSDAQSLYEEIFETRRRLLGPDHLNTLTAMGNLAMVLMDRGDFLESRNFIDKVLASWSQLLGEEIQDTMDTLMAKGEIARSLYELGLLAEAREMEEHALEVMLRLVAPENEAVIGAMWNLALTRYELGDLAGARTLQEHVVARRRIMLGSEHPETLMAMANLASILEAQKDLTGAEELKEEIVTVWRRTLGPMHPDTLRAEANLAGTLTSKGDGASLAEAKALQEKVLERKEDLLGPEHPETLMVMGNLALILYKQGDLLDYPKLKKKARTLEEHVLGVRRRVLGAGHPHTLASMSNLALTIYAEGDLEGSRQLHEEALRIRVDRRILESAPRTEPGPNTIGEAANLAGLASIHRDNGDLEKALQYYVRLLDTLETTIRYAGVSEETRSSYAAKYYFAYRDTISAQLDLLQMEEAFYTLERSRAQSFLRMLNDRNLRFPDIPEKLDQERRRIGVLYDRLTQERDKLSQEDARFKELSHQLRVLRHEREAIGAGIRRVSPRQAELHDPKPITLEDIRQALDPGTLMLSYSVGEKRTDIFMLTRDSGITHKRLQIERETLQNQINRYTAQMRGGSRQSASRHLMGKWLYERLLAPAEAQIERSQRLLIVPDGPLHLLPFSALIRDLDEKGEGERDWQYLVEWKPVHIVLSASVYARLREMRRPAQPLAEKERPKLVAFGDPFYPNAEHEPLPFSRHEVREIGRIYAEAPARAYLGRDATEAQAKAVGTDVRILHFAVHGVLDSKIPLDSSLALTIPEERAEEAENGLLQAWEIFESVRLDADLVVLSVCDAAFGPERGGEGLISLSRAFQYAGARSVVATLWSVNDNSTAELMILFHKYLCDGMPTDEALRAAQLEMIRSPIGVTKHTDGVEEIDCSAPYHWAAFQLIGDWL